MFSDVLVEQMVKEALIRAELRHRRGAVAGGRGDLSAAFADPLRAGKQSGSRQRGVQEARLREQLLPFRGKREKCCHRLFRHDDKGAAVLNEYVVTNQWIYPKSYGGKRLDIVLLVNGFPIAVGELKTPAREAISWMDGAGDILSYAKKHSEDVRDECLQLCLRGQMLPLRLRQCSAHRLGTLAYGRA